jgi:GxxExxY protein
MMCIKNLPTHLIFCSGRTLTVTDKPLKGNQRKDAKTQGRQEQENPSAPSHPCSVALTENAISRHIVEAAIEVHRTLGGPGLLESVYEEALVWELQQRGLGIQRQVSLPIPYKGHLLASPLRIGLVVGGLVIVECKAVTQYNAIFEAQVLTYLRLAGLKLGLVVNFGGRVVKDGIRRVVNGL